VYFSDVFVQNATSQSVMRQQPHQNGTRLPSNLRLTTRKCLHLGTRGLTDRQTQPKLYTTPHNGW